MAFDSSKIYQGGITSGERGIAEMLNSAYLQTGTTDPDASNAGNEGVQYLNTTTGEVFRDDGSAWVSVGHITTASAQTVTGKKTFTSKPVLPASAPTGNEAVSKSRADTLIANAVTVERNARNQAVADLTTRVAALETSGAALYYSPNSSAVLRRFNLSGFSS